MSEIGRNLSRRGRVLFVATFLLVAALVFAVPGVGNARNAIKQFKASVDPTTASGHVPGTWKETVQNCGPASTAPCDGSHPSTINMGTIQIAVPPEFRPITSVSAASPSGQTTRNWTVSYNADAGTINGYANQGTDKLQPGESILITFSATPSTCTGPTPPGFTISAWGSTPTPGTDVFTNQSSASEYSVTISGCQLSPGGSITGPNGTTVTAGTDWTGTVDVSFQGTLACPGNPKWDAGYHLPDVVTIDPSGVTSTTVKSFTFSFVGVADSSFYVICYSHSDTDPTGMILDPCYSGSGDALDTPPPCVAKQYKVFDSTNTVKIKIRVPAGDPRAH